jgi:hypothetical protein
LLFKNIIIKYEYKKRGEYIMIINRYAISALSKQNRINAVPEEIMIHKKTGEVLIKTSTGDVISFDSMARLKSHIDMATFNCFNLNLFGNMYQLNFDTIELPDVIIEDINLLGAPLQVSTGDIKKILISIDLDSVELTGLDIPSDYEPIVKLDFELVKDTDRRASTISYPLSIFNNNVIRLEDYITEIDPTGFQIFINGITISRNPAILTTDLRQILYSIIIIKE